MTDDGVDAKVLVGFTSEMPVERDVTGRPYRSAPFPDLPGSEQLFVTMAIDRGLLADEAVRDGFAEYIGRRVGDKIRDLIRLGLDAGGSDA
jgi:hypothetical protein